MPEIVQGGEPVVRGQLVVRQPQDLVETAQVFRSLTREDRDVTHHPHRPTVDPIAREHPLPRRDHILARVDLYPIDVHIHMRRERRARVPDHQIRDHIGTRIIQRREPVLGGQFVRRVAQHFVETGQIFRAFTGEDRYPIRAHHPHRSTVDAIAREHPLPRCDRERCDGFLYPRDVHIHNGVLGIGARVSDHQIGDHAQVIQGREPVLGRQLVGWIAQHFVETVAVDHPLAREDRDAVGADHPHRSTVDAIAREDARARCDRERCDGFLHPRNVHIHQRVLVVGAGIPDHQIGGHAHVIQRREPVLRRQLVGWNTDDRVEAAAVDRALAGEDRFPVRADHPHRSAVDAVAGKGAVT